MVLFHICANIREVKPSLGLQVVCFEMCVSENKKVKNNYEDPM